MHTVPECPSAVGVARVIPPRPNITKEEIEEELRLLRQQCNEWQARLGKNRATIKELLFVKAVQSDINLGEQKKLRKAINTKMLANKVGRTAYKMYKE